ncbi:hypothetical protein D3C84_1119550 [compost metagenome]
MQADCLESFSHLFGTGREHGGVGKVIGQRPNHHRTQTTPQQVQPGKEQGHGGGSQARLDHVLDRRVDAGIEVIGKQPAQAEHGHEHADLDPPRMQRPGSTQG